MKLDRDSAWDKGHLVCVFELKRPCPHALVAILRVKNSPKLAWIYFFMVSGEFFCIFSVIYNFLILYMCMCMHACVYVCVRVCICMYACMHTY